MVVVAAVIVPVGTPMGCGGIEGTTGATPPAAVAVAMAAAAAAVDDDGGGATIVVVVPTETGLIVGCTTSGSCV